MCDASKQASGPSLMVPLDGAFILLSLDLAAPLQLLLRFMSAGPNDEQIKEFIRNEEGRYYKLLEAGLIQGINARGYPYSSDFPEPKLTKLGERYMAAFKCLQELRQ